MYRDLNVCMAADVCTDRIRAGCYTKSTASRENIRTKSTAGGMHVTANLAILQFHEHDIDAATGRCVRL